MVKIATPEHKAKAILIVFQLDYVHDTAEQHVFAQTNPTSAAQMTTANFAKELIVSILRVLVQLQLHIQPLDR